MRRWLTDRQGLQVSPLYNHVLSLSGRDTASNDRAADYAIRCEDIFDAVLLSTSRRLLRLTRGLLLLSLPALVADHLSCRTLYLAQRSRALAVRSLLLTVVDVCSYFYATVQLGSPPREFAVIVDTGSTVTYVPCASCGNSCGANHQVPKPYAIAHARQALIFEMPLCGVAIQAWTCLSYSANERALNGCTCAAGCSI